MKSCFLSAALVCAAFLCAAQTELAPKKTLHAVRISEKIVLDGDLNEPIWQSAEVATDFLHLWPTPGRPGTQKTEVRVVYDDNALYVGAFCRDARPDSIFHRLSKRDELENTDGFSVIIDTYQDGQNAVKFGVTPDNVQYDSKFSLANANPNEDNADGEDYAWDAVWRSAARITAEGWVAELEIPYSALRFPKKDAQRWSVNFIRSVKRRGETDSWNEVKAEIAGNLNQMGILEGISGIKAPLRLSATPFATAYADNAYNQPGSTWSFPYSVGMDVKYGLNEAFTLDATIIPDFGQVRTDAFVYNLSPFEVRFNENRQFFTEGTELFNKGGFFYSRRIGGAPIRYWDAVAEADATGEEIVKNPSKVQLLNATKVSGRTNSGLGVGIFNAVESATFATLRNPETGVERDYQTSPLTNRNILVFDQNLPNNSSVTLLNTNVMRSGSDRDANLTAAMFNLKNKAQRYGLSGKMAYSSRIYPDSAENGYTASLDFSKTSGNFLFGLSGNLESREYNPRDMGFLFSANELSGNAWVNYSRYKPWKFMNNFWSSLWVYRGALWSPNRWTETQFGTNFGFNTRSFHNFGIWTNFSPWGDRDYFEPRTDDFVHFYRTPANFNVGFWYNSDHRRRFTFHLNGGYLLFDEPGRWRLRLNPNVRWRATDKLTLGIGAEGMTSRNNVGITYWLDENAVGYDQLSGTEIVFGHRDVRYFDNYLEISYSFNNKMNVALFARHYWQKVAYQSFENLQNDGSLLPSAYAGRDASGAPLNDLAVNYFNIDCVYTWRFAPGSDLLLVYKNGIQDETSTDVAHNYFYSAGRLHRFAGTNSLTLKVLYYLDYEGVKKMIR